METSFSPLISPACFRKYFLENLATKRLTKKLSGVRRMTERARIQFREKIRMIVIRIVRIPSTRDLKGAEESVCYILDIPDLQLQHIAVLLPEEETDADGVVFAEDILPYTEDDFLGHPADAVFEEEVEHSAKQGEGKGQGQDPDKGGLVSSQCIIEGKTDKERLGEVCKKEAKHGEGKEGNRFLLSFQIRQETLFGVHLSSSFLVWDSNVSQ
jgi:hypothetical protein